MLTTELGRVLWTQIRHAWNAGDERPARLETEISLLDPLSAAWHLFPFILTDLESADQTFFITWLNTIASQTDHPFWIHLLGFCGWDQPFRPDSNNLLSLLTGSLELSLRNTTASTNPLEMLDEAYSTWDKKLGRKPTPVSRAILFQALAKVMFTIRMTEPELNALARPLLVVLLRRLADDTEGALQQLERLRSIDWSTHQIGHNYQALLAWYQPFGKLERDRHRAEQMLLLYFRRLASDAEPLEELQERLNNYLRANELRLASLQGLIREPRDDEARISYRLLNHNGGTSALSFARVGIHGWYGEPAQWHSYLKLRGRHLLRQNQYQQELSLFWENIQADDLERMYPQNRFETVWIPGHEIEFYALVSKILSPEAQVVDILAQEGLHQSGQAMTRLLDALERYLFPARTFGPGTGWPDVTQPLALVAWVLGDELLLSADPAILKRNLERLRNRELPDNVPDSLLQHTAWYRQLSPEQWRMTVPWPLFNAEQDLEPERHDPYICFVHPLGFERLTDGTRVPAALICGRFYPDPEHQTPFVASRYQRYLQPVLGLCRHIIDMAVYRQRQEHTSRIARQSSEMAIMQEQERYFARIQTQMREYDAARERVDSLWNGIRQTLTPPGFAAYGIIDWQRLLDVFNDTRSIRGVKGAHNLASVTANQLTVFLDYLCEGQLREDTFIAQLRQCWHKLPQPGDLDARRYFALLKLVAHDGFASGKPLALIQLLVALRLAMTRPGLSLNLAYVSPSGEQDLSDLLSVDACTSGGFFEAVSQLSGFDFARSDYTLSTPPRDTLALPQGLLAGEVCLRLLQLMREELYHPEQPDWLSLQAVQGLWRHQPAGDSLQLRFECGGHYAPDLPVRLQPATDGRPHGLRDSLQILLAACGAEQLVFDPVPDEALPPEAGLTIRNLDNSRCLIQLQFGPAGPTSTLDHWVRRWAAGRQRPHGI